MKKYAIALSLSVIAFSGSANAAFKEFSLRGHSVTTYNEEGYTLGIDMKKEGGEKIFIANLILPEGRNFNNDSISSTFSFDSESIQSLSDIADRNRVGKNDEAVSWEIERFSDGVRSVPKSSELYEFMRRYHLKFNYVDSDGRARSTQIGLRNSFATLSELIKR